MFNFKKKRPVKELRINFVDEKDHSYNHERTYKIPEKCSVKFGEFSGKLMIFDEDKYLVKRIEFQAGFTREIEYLY